MATQASDPAVAPAVPAGVVLAQAQVEANASTRSKLTLQAQWQAAALLQAFTGWYRDASVRELGQRIAQIVAPAQEQMASAQAAYLNWVIQSQTGRSSPPGSVVSSAETRLGVSGAEAFGRLGEQYRYSKSISGFEDAERAHLAALQATINRANVMIDTDISLTARAQSRETLSAAKAVTGYRRVVHPEVSKGGTCGMCLAASDRIYHKKDLLPIHARCRCEVMPITRGDEPGASLNNISLGELYANAGDKTSIAALARTRYTVEHHDELGPQLVLAK